MKILLPNSFHKTEMTLRVNKEKIRGGLVHISKTTARKIKNTLCGVTECQCGITRHSENQIGECTSTGEYAIEISERILLENGIEI